MPRASDLVPSYLEVFKIDLSWSVNSDRHAKQWCRVSRLSPTLQAESTLSIPSWLSPSCDWREGISAWLCCDRRREKKLTVPSTKHTHWVGMFSDFLTSNGGLCQRPPTRTRWLGMAKPDVWAECQCERFRPVHTQTHSIGRNAVLKKPEHAKFHHGETMAFWQAWPT